MRPRCWTLIASAALLAALLAPGAPAADEPETVEATATAESAASYDQAVEKAIRNVVRQKGGVIVESNTSARDFELVRDSIYSRARGYVRRYRVLDRKRGLGGTYLVKLWAEVGLADIRRDALAVKSLIKLKGRPRFMVTIREDPDTKREVSVWVKGALNDHLEQKGFSALHARTRKESILRQFNRAVEAGETEKARQLNLQMGAPYGVDIVAFAEETERQTYGTTMNEAVVQLQAYVTHRDTGEMLASKSATGRAGSFDTTGLQQASRQAVDELFPKVLDRILYHWTEDMDVGVAVTVQAYDVPFSVGTNLKEQIAAMEGVTSAKLVEWPADGIGVMRVVGRVKGAEIARRIPAWTNNRFVGGLVGPTLVSIRPAETETEAPAATEAAGPAQPPEPPEESASDPDAGASPSDDAAPGEPDGAGSSDSGPEPRAPTGQRPPSGPDYTIPAAIVGGCVFLGIIFAAVILRRP